MKIGAPLFKILNKIYQPSITQELKFGRYDLVLQTDEQGRAILLFIGQKAASGQIKGERFSRHIVTDALGDITKDHWDNKGKTNQ
jgi:hypothetical protein